VKFTCKRCGAKYEALPPESNGVPRLPPEITTERNGKQEWEFCCAGGCKKESE
jgi:hypothetical protein